MDRQLLIAVGPGELRALLLEGERAVELRIARDGERGRVGELYLGRVVKLLPALPAALVEIGLDRPAFLSAEDAIAPPDKRAAGIAAWLTEGQSVLVQVTRAAQGGKAPSVSMRTRLEGRLLTLTPMRARIVLPKHAAPEACRNVAAAIEPILPEGVGAIIGSDALNVEPEVLLAELAALKARWQMVQLRASQAPPSTRLDEDAGLVGDLIDAFRETSPQHIVVDDRATLAAARRHLARMRPALPPALTLHEGDDDIFERYGVADDFAVVLGPRVELPGAGALIIETTAAMAVIDVDAGEAAGKRGDPRGAALAVNLSAAQAAARQIRLRNLAGAIVIDFISMARRADRERVAAVLEGALAGDPARPQILGWTRLGHFELTRRRRDRPVAEIVFDLPGATGTVKSALTTALEALRAAARQAAHQPGRAPVIIVHPAVAAALDGAAASARRQLEAALARPIAIVEDPRRERDSFDIRYD